MQTVFRRGLIALVMAMVIVGSLPMMGTLAGCGGTSVLDNTIGGSTTSGTTTTTTGGTTGGTTTGGTTGTNLSINDALAARSANQGNIVTAGAIEPVAYLADTANSGAVGSYPIVTVTGNTTITTVTVDYGATPVTANGGRSISGVFTLTRNATTNTGSITFTNVTINGRKVSGTVTLSNLSVTSAQVSGTMAFDLILSGYGHSVGTFSFTSVRATHVLTIPTGSFTLTPQGSTTSYTVTLNNIVCDPVKNGNFVPDAGTTTVSYSLTRSGQSVTITVVATYTANTPSTGLVDVTVDGSGAIPYLLPRFR